MAENLNYNATGSKCYGTIESYCSTYSRLYDWATAMTACPSGWHLPSNAEWDVLMKFVDPSCSDNSTCASAGKLKATSGWNKNGNKSGNGTDNYGFSALPGGWGGGSDGYFYYVGTEGDWWSASEIAYGFAHYRYMSYASENTYQSNNRGDLFSVRCLKD